ncbi:MAG TPA: hotdog fold thioesterase [Flavisolibacter sp.]|jgi:1,4-dihydroxy-2-naphthoyl-CoA hydrolase|nr:hotdog fold thioesterase [Flavisolibacter sp.]
MAIWFKNYTLEELSGWNEDTMTSHIGIRLTKIGEGSLTGTMPVDHRTKQPMGIVHGGASVALAETLGSIAANMVINREEKVCVGLEINANHIRSANSGTITGVAKPLHLGSSTQVWSIEMFDDAERLTCISRITMAVLDRKKFKS